MLACLLLFAKHSKPKNPRVNCRSRLLKCPKFELNLTYLLSIPNHVCPNEERSGFFGKGFPSTLFYSKASERRDGPLKGFRWNLLFSSIVQNLSKYCEAILLPPKRTAEHIIEGVYAQVSAINSGRLPRSLGFNCERASHQNELINVSEDPKKSKWKFNATPCSTFSVNWKLSCYGGAQCMFGLKCLGNLFTRSDLLWRSFQGFFNQVTRSRFLVWRTLSNWQASSMEVIMSNKANHSRSKL